MNTAKFFKTGLEIYSRPGSVVYFSVTSNGMTGEEWVEHFEKKGVRIEGSANKLLLSPSFKPTSGITTKVAILSSTLFRDMARELGKSEEVRGDAHDFGFTDPEIEISCLIRDMFSDEEIKSMGLCNITVMHKPVNLPSFSGKLLFNVSTGDGGNLLTTRFNWTSWGQKSGVAFVAENGDPK